MSAVLVTGATGQVGGALVDELLRRGAPVRAMARTRERAEELAARGADAVVADLGRPESLPATLDGVDRVFLMSRDDPRQAEMEGALVEAAVRAGAEGIVKLSANGARPDNPIALMRHHAETERVVEGSGMAHTILRPQLYMQNFLRFGPDIAVDGRFAAPMCDRLFALVDVRDVARVAAAALIEEGHDGANYVVSGPEALSYGEAATIIGTAIGKEVAYEPVEPEAFREVLITGRGLPRWRAEELAFIASAYGVEEGALVTDVVRRISGQGARTFAEFVEDHADQLAGNLSNET